MGTLEKVSKKGGLAGGGHSTQGIGGKPKRYRIVLPQKGKIKRWESSRKKSWVLVGGASKKTVHGRGRKLV